MLMSSPITTLDVRPDFRSGQHPCDKIQNALGSVRAGETLRLLVPFEPVPLFDVAASKGLGHKSTQISDGDWEVIFAHDIPTAATAQNHSACGCSSNSSAEIIEVDARHLEPPQPMVRILEALSQLPNGASVRARTDRRPIHLYAHLEDRGFTGESEEQSDGSFITHIRRA
jgi:uncharacterized protein (DUF2249 family)